MARKFRDYSNKRWANPMFERKSGLKRHLPWGRWLGGLAVVALVGAGIWLLFFSDFLRFVRTKQLPDGVTKPVAYSDVSTKEKAQSLIKPFFDAKPPKLL